MSVDTITPPGGILKSLKSTMMIAFVAISVASLSGCSKKVVKDPETAPEPTKPAVVAESAKPPETKSSPVEAVAAKPDMDALCRDNLVAVYFQYDQYSLSQDALDQLAKIGSFLKDNSSIVFVIEGHADERGSSDYNMGLGENRAKTVRDWLETYGIAKNRIEVTSFGKERPAVANCEDDDCHAKNRRVEFKVTSK